MYFKEQYGVCIAQLQHNAAGLERYYVCVCYIQYIQLALGVLAAFSYSLE